jgi:hypothetical protein
MSQLTAPPVPQGLREMLTDYPELIERLQVELNYLVEKPSPVTPPFERAVWMLEDTLDLFISEARRELHAAREKGSAHEIAGAQGKLDLLIDCKAPTSWQDENLSEYFAGHGVGERHVP